MCIFKGIRWLRRLIKTLIGIVLVLFVILAGALAYLKLPVGHYYSISEKGFKIPELNKGFIPQGISYDSRTDNFFVTGYEKDGSASPVFLVNKTSGKTTHKVLLADAENVPFAGHNGGIAVNGEFVYIAGAADECVYVYSYNEILAASSGAQVKMLGKFSLSSENDKILSSFVTIADNRLYIGEFYRAGNYETPEGHKMSEENRAYIVGFDFESGAEFGLASTPSVGYSIRGLVQGAFFTEDTIYLSTSYGIAKSHIYAYDRKKAENSLAKKSILDTNVSFFTLDSANRTKDLKAAPMSEEIEIVDGKMYTMCESASDKYVFGKLTGAKWCIATIVSKI